MKKSLKAQCQTGVQISTPYVTAEDAAPDPIFHAIERHREAMVAMDRAGCELSRLRGLGIAHPLHQEAENRFGRRLNSVDAIGDDLADTVPTTRAGIEALIDYVVSVDLGRKQGHLEWPVGEEGDGDALSFHGRVMHAIQRALSEIGGQPLARAA